MVIAQETFSKKRDHPNSQGDRDRAPLEVIIRQDLPNIWIRNAVLSGNHLGPETPIGGKTATFHLDNENAANALIRNNDKPEIITAVTHLAWYRLNQLNLTAWFEWVPSNRNIADLPTRRAKLPCKTIETKEFPRLRELYGLIKQAITALQTSRPIPMPKCFDQ